MAFFRVKGGNSLKGEIIPQGAKNEALQVICATLLTDQPVFINNIPEIRDVNKLIELISEMGVHVQKKGSGSYQFDARNVDITYLESPEFKEKAATLRGSIMILGPLLARFGKANIPRPGGDKIGRRRLDTHFTGFEKIGARFRYDDDDKYYHIDAS